MMRFFRLAAVPGLLVTLGLTLSLAACGDSNPKAADAAQDSTKYGAIDTARLLAADSDADNWLTSGRDYGKTHFSPLADINKDNASRLGVAWDYSTATNRGLEATPIVVDGIMYTSGPFGQVYALDATTGDEIWYFDPHADGQAARFACCGTVNRGVAVWKGKVYVAALDGRLIALDAATGKELWSTDTFIYPNRAYASTGAPQVAGKVVVIGNSGAEFDARGYVSAYDLDTGELKWRFFTVPGDPKKGFENPELADAAKTWDPNSRWDVGGGGTVWGDFVYDPKLNLLYFGTGNAEPYNKRERSPSDGDNLFTSSILAINPDTGRLAWYYQEVPGDQWDFDSDEPIILADMSIGGRDRQVLMHAPKDGFFYILDRKTGELLSANAFADVNWATHVDMTTGRPVQNPDAADYDTGMKLVYPSPAGAHNWHRMSYSPQTHLVYLPVTEMGMYTVDPTKGHKYTPKTWNVGMHGHTTGGLDLAGTMNADEQKIIDSGKLLKYAPKDQRARSMLTAWDPITSTAKWSVESAGWWDRAGVLSTGGGLVFQGTATGHFKVFDADTGDLLKDIDVGTAIVAAPMTYRVNGVQYVAVMAAGGGVPLSFLPPPESANVIYGNDGRILVFKLDGKPVVKPAKLPVMPIPEPPMQTADAATIAKGAPLFGGFCSPCHSQRPGTDAADLRYMSAATHKEFDDIVLKGARRERGMPQWDDMLSKADAEAIHAYIISFQWDAYRAAHPTSQ